MEVEPILIEFGHGLLLRDGPDGDVLGVMNASDRTVSCPYCGEPGNLEVEPTEEPGEQVFVEDCGVCCRPWTVRVYTDAEGQLDISVERS